VAGRGVAWRPWPAHRAARLAALVSASLVALVALTPGRVQAQSLQLDAQLAASLAVLPAPLVAPRPPLAQVVPAQVQRWRQEAQALEHGENGYPRDPARAATLYCQAAQQGDAEAQFSLAWMLTNGRGIERDDAQAAHLFQAAAEQGLPQAQRIAASMGTPLGVPPPCLHPPAIVAPKPLLVAAAAAMRNGRPAPNAGNPAANSVAAQPVAAAPPLPANAPPPIVNYVRLIAPDYQLTPQLVLAIMATESNFNPNAVSPKQAQGLMQLIPDTAARFKVHNLMDPAQNIRGGMAYLRWLMAYFEGDVMLVAAAYNAGERAVERYRGVPPYAETREYVRRILAAVGTVSHPFDARITAPSPLLPLMRVLDPAPAPLRR
jgi:soluble lytic murein transglycosylase-like protein